MKLIESSADSEYMAQKVNDTNGCYVVPAFTGLGAPYWDQYARGTILGLTRGVNKYHVIRATLESITYQVDDVLKAMEADSGMKLSALRVDGGASANNFLMQCQADISQAPVERPCCIETTAMGAAYLAGLAVGYWPDQETVKQNGAIDRTFEPELSKEERDEKMNGWQQSSPLRRRSGTNKKKIFGNAEKERFRNENRSFSRTVTSCLLTLKNVDMFAV